ncbi:sensor domain-containing diguanylate cyclase [Pontibacillus sp. HMF3514]|uniref:sensor domain-containing diguanylate cyclase n=1 Tax=Pontibacillus sp. HMF3514 TaxID=2692425 RepID=UPI00131FFA41|nr:sensor domain-containing diguanylate cyclase [Pontibacillus sp. HMF3514]QHE53152.1 diguanylate cyclase [Pontibacillus sp. HMF3514]
MISKQKVVGIWGVWALLYPTTLIMIYNVFPSPTFDSNWFDLISFAVLMSIVAMLPIIVNDTPVFFIHGISIAVFLYYGLFTEMILTQLAYVMLIMKIRLPKTLLYKIPLNLVMFLTISILSALVYYILDGEHGQMAMNSPRDAIPITGYVVSYFLTNQILLSLIRKYIVGEPQKFFNKGFLWDFYNTLFVIPIGFVLYILYVEIGTQAIYYVGVPFVSLSLILMLYYSSRRINGYLQKTSEIGHELTGKLEADEVLDRFVERISSLLDVDYAYVYDVNRDDPNHEYLKLIRFYDSEHHENLPKVTLNKFESVSGKVWGNAQGLHYRSRKQWSKSKSSGQASFIPEDVESVISIPIERDGRVVGVLTLASKKKRAYEKYQYMIADILTNYLAVALLNARNYEETKRKSEICPLTKLYNYRYFENHLENYFNELNKQNREEHISIVLIDLDHFKQVNDMYGHESGNEALCELAERLINIIDDKGTVARYGGEEFVILLPNVNQEHAYHIAENVRRKIANEPFILSEHIMDDSEPVKVNLTASLGTATYPEDCEDPRELVRHADRAMYMGAKRKGRNKVAAYEK